jgi:thermostable 8-oxoguanine DNA glycosylase
MKIVWKLTSEDVEYARNFVESRRDHAFVRGRIERNVENPPISVSIDRFWERLVGSLLTSRQRSGPGSAVARFLRSDPFLLSYDVYKSQSDPEEAAEQILKEFGGIRFNSRIADYLARNYKPLSKGLWKKTDGVLESLINQESPALERQAAEFLRENFVGLGPKQSRNLLQGLGLTQYEIPLDSRITRWLNDFGFPVHLSAASLADPDYYNFVSDGVQAICGACEILPCVFDAAVFSSYDEGWTEDNVIW